MYIYIVKCLSLLRNNQKRYDVLTKGKYGIVKALQMADEKQPPLSGGCRCNMHIYFFLPCFCSKAIIWASSSLWPSAWAWAMRETISS